MTIAPHAVQRWIKRIMEGPVDRARLDQELRAVAPCVSALNAVLAQMDGLVAFSALLPSITDTGNWAIQTEPDDAGGYVVEVSTFLEAVADGPDFGPVRNLLNARGIEKVAAAGWRLGFPYACGIADAIQPTLGNKTFGRRERSRNPLVLGPSES